MQVLEILSQYQSIAKDYPYERGCSASRSGQLLIECRPPLSHRRNDVQEVTCCADEAVLPVLVVFNS
jgi:hypothetical protein